MTALGWILALLALGLALITAGYVILARTRTPGLPGQTPPRFHCQICLWDGDAAVSFGTAADLQQHLREVHHVPLR